MDSQQEKAMQLYGQNYNCGQAVVGAFAGKYGLDESTALKLGGGLGGGMRVGDVCGAVSGAVLVVGLKYGMDKPGDKEQKQLCNEKTTEFMKAYRTRFGNLTCRALKTDKIDCKTLILGAVDLLNELGY